MAKKIYIANDHGGLLLKAYLMDQNYGFDVEWVDLGTNDTGSADYPDYAAKMARAMTGEGSDVLGVLICGSGIGMSMMANRFTHIRAAVCHDITTASLARQHNNANVICIGERLIGQKQAFDTVKAFLSEEFEPLDRYERRVEKMTAINTGKDA
jgi:ribose 5-phosphate isomerase B